MQNGSQVSLDAEAFDRNCAFCQRNDIACNILKETRFFLVVTDHAPLIEGHILVIPKSHYACYGAVPRELDAELYALKLEVQQFFVRYYVPAVFWKHAFFRKQVFIPNCTVFP